MEIPKQPTLRIEEVFLNEDYTTPPGYILNELKTSTNKGQGKFYAVLVRIDSVDLPKPKKGSGIMVPKP